MTINYNDFKKLKMAIGTIVEVRDFPKARKPAYQLLIDFGKMIGVKKSSAQITELYKKEDLVDRQIIAVINFPPKQIANFMSEVLVLGAEDEGKAIVLLAPEQAVPNGTLVY